MPKRSASDALQAVVPGPKNVESNVKSRSGRVVRPKVWDDGTLAAPLAALKEDPLLLGERSPASQDRSEGEEEEAGDAGDPDFSLQGEQGGGSDDGGVGTGRASGSGGGRGQHSGGSGGGRGAHAGHAGVDHSGGEEGPAYSDDSPRASVGGGGSQCSLGRARSGSIGRDEHGKFTSGPRPRGSRGRGRGEGGGGIFKQAAVEVLRLEKRLMSTGEIARVALKRGLIKCTGKTPEATMASALYTDIKRKEGHSVFIRPHEGLFGLREWIEQGVAFQDEFAEELAKRARAAFGMYAGMPGMPGVPLLPPMMDSEGVPIATPFPAMMMPYPGMPHIPGMPLPLGLMPGMPPAAAAAMAAAAAGRAAAGANDSADGLMELLSAAEELHRSSSKESEGAAVKYDAEGNPLPAAAGQEAGAAVTAAPEQHQQQQVQEDGKAAPMAVDGQQQQQDAAAAAAVAPAAGQGEGAPQPAASEVAAGAAAAMPAAAPAGEDEEGDAAAMLAAVAGAAADEPGSRQQQPRGPAFPGFEGAAAGPEGAPMPPYPVYPMPYGYFPAPPHFLFGQAGPPPGLPPLPKTRSGRPGSGSFDSAAAAAAAATGELAAVGSGSAAPELVVLGTNRPFAGGRGGAAAAAAAAAAHADGQEQVNILNLPLPEAEAQGAALAARGTGGALPPPTGAPPSVVEPSQLKEAEAQVMSLERELGTSHPEVGKAYLALSRLYLAGCAESASKQLAVAALSRAAEIMSVCQVALKRQPSCTSSFSYLMEKIRTAEQRPAAAAAAGPAAAPAGLPATAAAAAVLAPSPLPAERTGGQLGAASADGAAAAAAALAQAAAPVEAQ